MQRLLEEVLCPSHLDETARIHHRNALAGLRHHPHVVRDEDDRQAKLPAQFGQELEDLVLHRHVERRRRLIRQDNLGEQASAVAITTRWHMPPLKACG